MRVPLSRITLHLLLAMAAACSSSYPSAPLPPAAPEVVQVSWCPGAAPVWVAFQDGDGPWTRVLPGVAEGNATYRSEFRSNRGALARVSVQDNGFSQLSVLYGAPAELMTAGVTNPAACGSLESKTLLGTIQGLGAGETAIVTGGGLSRTRVASAAENDFALEALPGGPHDLIAARSTSLNGVPSVTGLILRRDVNVPDGTVLPVFDFASAEAFAPAPATVTLDGLGDEGASLGFRLLTGTTDILLTPTVGALHDVTRAYPALPANRLREGDLQLLGATSHVGQAGRISQLFFRNPANLTLTLPAPLIRPAIDMAATLPFLRPRALFAPQAEYDRETGITWQQGLNTLVTVSMTPTYAARSGTGYTLMVPDLSGLPGFNSAWLLHPGTSLIWTASRVGGTMGLGLDALPVAGSTRLSAFDSDLIPAP